MRYPAECPAFEIVYVPLYWGSVLEVGEHFEGTIDDWSRTVRIAHGLDVALWPEEVRPLRQAARDMLDVIRE